MSALADGPVLCGIDFSDDSRHALRVAAGLARRLGRPLVVMTAIDPLLAEAGALRYGPHKISDDTAAALATLVTEEIGSAGAPTVAAVIGHGAEALLRDADERQAAVIVVGTRGLGRAKRLMFGSTTLTLLRHTTRPVLAVPAADQTSATEHAAFTSIVCGVDFGEASVHAARVAADVASRLSAALVLVHAVPVLIAPTPLEALALAAAGDRVSDGDTRVRALAETLRMPQPPECVTRAGDVTDVLTEEAVARGPALLVLGLGGRDGHRPGTHAYRILTHSAVPVLAVTVSN